MKRKLTFVILIISIQLMNAQFSIAPQYSWSGLNEPKMFRNKLQLSFVNGDGGFPSYGTVLAGGAYGPAQDGSVFQLYFPYSEEHGGVAPRVRLGLYDNRGWSNWETMFTTANANLTTVDWKTRKLNASDDINSEGKLTLSASSLIAGDIISIYGSRFNALDMYGFGVEPGVLYAKAETTHRWYIAKNADLGVSSKMELNNGMLYVADKLGIGTKDTKGYALAVSGSIVSEEVKVALKSNWPDYVFRKDYVLPTLEQVEKHIVEKGHLENIPCEKEVLKDGINLGEMNAKLLQKIEELTLYVIEIKKEVALIKNENELMKENHIKLEKIIRKNEK
ncbi:hypothetical protein AB9T89_18710 [Flavobacterium oncorhynchi]|uniref:hypothetical protein n=1 Tax=Flavobacterium oncorhynchi TaxID=728056 RepID=UPI00351A5B5B